MQLGIGDSRWFPYGPRLEGPRNYSDLTRTCACTVNHAHGFIYPDTQILNPREVRDLGMWAASGLLPDLTILLDVPAEIVVRLVGIPDSEGEAAEQLEFHQQLRLSFLKIARRDPQRFLIVDAEQPFDKVAATVAQEIVRRISA